MAKPRFTYRIVKEDSRLAIYRYSAALDFNGTYTWQKLLRVVRSITELNEKILRRKFPEAFEEKIGCIHKTLIPSRGKRKVVA